MEARLFEPGTIPECATPEWYETRERAPHLEQGGHRGRLDMAMDFVSEAWTPGKSVVDLGAGDGGLLSLLWTRCRIPGWGYDLQETNVEGAAERGVNVQLCDIVAHPEEVQWAAIAVATEMLEHLVDPHAFVRSIQSDILVASSPVNETAESHYAFHLWAWDMDGYAALITQGGYTVDRHECTGDFQVIRGVRSPR